MVGEIRHIIDMVNTPTMPDTKTGDHLTTVSCADLRALLQLVKDASTIIPNLDNMWLWKGKNKAEQWMAAYKAMGGE